MIIVVIISFGLLGVWQERAQADSCREAETGEGGAHDWEAGGSPVDAFSWGGIVLGGGPLDVGSEFERRLSIGANIACRLRGAVRDQLGEPRLLQASCICNPDASDQRTHAR